MIQVLLQANKEMKRLSPEKVVSTIEFDGGSQEVLRNKEIECVFDIFGRHKS